MFARANNHKFRFRPSVSDEETTAQNVNAKQQQPACRSDIVLLAALLVSDMRHAARCQIRTNDTTRHDNCKHKHCPGFTQRERTFIYSYNKNIIIVQRL